MEQDYKYNHKVRQAHDFEAQGKLLHAVQIYNSLLLEFPEKNELYVSLANLYEYMGNIDSALNLLNSNLSDHPDNVELRIFLGQFLLKHSRWEDSIEALSFVLPEEEPVVSFFTGYAHFMLKEYELAKISFLNFISFEQQTELLHEAHIYLAKIELKLKEYNSALYYAKKAEVLYSNFWELNFIYAETYFSLGMFAHAAAPIEKAIKLSPEEASPYELAGKIYLKLGDYLKAEKYFLEYIEKIENVSSDIYTRLAEACLNAEKTKDAIAYFEIAIKLDPENKTALAGKDKAASILKNNMASDG